MSFQSDNMEYVNRLLTVYGPNSVRKIAIAAFNQVNRRTPVDTGRARSNWNISGNLVDTTTRGEDLTLSSVQGEISRGAAIAVGESQRFTELLKVKALAERAVARGDDINISNSLPYIRALEYGYSAQAPAGMVRVTIKDIESRGTR